VTAMHLTEMDAGHLGEVLSLVDALGFYPVNDEGHLRVNTVEDPTSPADLRLLAQLDGHIIGFCFACLRRVGDDDEETGVVKLFGVHPDYRRRGVATALFTEIERRLVERGITTCTVAGVGPHWFFAGVELTLTPAISFLMHRGYETDRRARVDMRVDLASADLESGSATDDLARQGIILRRAHPDDLPAVQAMVGSLFSPAWQVEVADSLRFSPLPLFLALDRNRVVAFAAYDVSGPRRFGPTGTHPGYRRRGIGGALLKMCLRDMRDRGDAIAEIGWVGPIGYYARTVGAEIHRAYWCFHKTLA